MTSGTGLGAIISGAMCLFRMRAVQIYALCVTSVLIISSASASAENQGQGQEPIEALQKRIEAFQKAFDTAMNAMQVSEVVRLQDGSSYLPRTSEDLTMKANQKVDAWGSPFCIIPIGERVAVVSGGPSHLSCDALPFTAEQMAESKQALYFGPSDVVVFIATRVRRP